MSGKPSDADQTSLKPAAGLLGLMRRLAAALPPAERRALAMTLVENDADEIKFRRSGATWTIAPWDRVISQFLFANGSFQGDEIHAVLNWMRRHNRFAARRDCIVDVGANIGTTAIPFARATTCRVVAIEPMPEPFALQTRNVADNDLTRRVSCVRAAVIAGAAKTVRVVVPVDNGGAGEVVRPGRRPSFDGREEVRVEAQSPADGLSASLDRQGVAPERIAFVGSDTQGCEIDVNETGLPLWAAGAPLFTEFDPRFYGPEGSGQLAEAARKRFAAFIPSERLIEDPKAAPSPIADLPAYCRSRGEATSDCLLIP